MPDQFEEFTRRKDYLICIDSDGCAIDTMDIKHIHCFGPCIIREWGLEPWRDKVQKHWNEINLYTMTRGINRFKGLGMALLEVNRQYKPIEGISQLLQWIDTANELSNENLEQAVKETGSSVLNKVLNWSIQVNQSIAALPQEEKRPFDGVAAGLRKAHECADVAVVSSANQQAIIEEWTRYKLLQHTDIILSQDAGSKSYCIKRLLEKGYERGRVLMVGDAPGDQEAAEENKVLYFPVLVGREQESWKRLTEEGVVRLQNHAFDEAYKEQLIRDFRENLQ